MKILVMFCELQLSTVSKAGVPSCWISVLQNVALSDWYESSDCIIQHYFLLVLFIIVPTAMWIFSPRSFTEHFCLKASLEWLSSEIPGTCCFCLTILEIWRTSWLQRYESYYTLVSSTFRDELSATCGNTSADFVVILCCCCCCFTISKHSAMDHLLQII